MKNLILLQKGKCTSTLYNRDGLLIETSLSYAIQNRMCFENGNLLVKQNVKGLRTEKGVNQEIWGRVTVINRLIADLRNKQDVQSLEQTRSSNNVCMKSSIKHVNLNFANYASWQAICSMQPYLGSALSDDGGANHNSNTPRLPFWNWIIQVSTHAESVCRCIDRSGPMQIYYCCKK